MHQRNHRIRIVSIQSSSWVFFIVQTFLVGETGTKNTFLLSST